MTPRYKKAIASFFLALFAAVVLSISYANASSSAAMAPRGDGLSSISGYTVENISYNLAQDPSQISSVSFGLNAAASHVKIRLTSTQTDWYLCHNIGGYVWQCDTNYAPVALADQFRVIASGS